MPESALDRPTSAHEKLYLLSKQARYYYDADAVRTTAKRETRKSPDGWDTAPGAHGTIHRGGREKGRWDKMSKEEQQIEGANLRNVWTIATAPHKGAHFATFPPALVEPCILAGTSEHGVCTDCGAPWKRETEGGITPIRGRGWQANQPQDDPLKAGKSRTPRLNYAWEQRQPITTTGWTPTCECGTLDTKPATILDPFGGSGTVALVAARHNRDAILIEISRTYAELARNRIHDDAPLLNNTEIVEATPHT